MKKNNAVIVLGSSRSNGNTKKVIDVLLEQHSEINLIDLNNYNIGYFDYDFKNKEDDFLPLIKHIINYDTIIFATPVYWYSMSAQLKTFFDRISDLLFEDKKHIGRQLRGKKMAVVSCSNDDQLLDVFDIPFKESAKYLGMIYLGHVHTWLNRNKRISKTLEKKLSTLFESTTN